MLKTILLLTTFTLLVYSGICLGQETTGQVYPESTWGTFTQNVEWRIGSDITCQSAPLIKGPAIIINWSKLEPTNNNYTFDERIGKHLEEIQACGWKCYVKIWVGGDDRIPDWLWDDPFNVEKVQVGGTLYPYYLNTNYQQQYWEMYEALAAYLLNLPADLRETVLFVQVAEGSTGDEGCYKNKTPDNLDYVITPQQYDAFRHETWGKVAEYLVERDENGNILKQIPFGANPGGTEDVIALLDATIGPNAVIKEGAITHGYHAGGNGGRVESLNNWRALADAQGKTLWSRGEFNQYGDPDMGWLMLNVPQGIYWSALCGLHAGVNMWNLQYTGAIDNEGVKNEAAIQIYNRYGGATNPQTSKWAFCAFHRGLDYSDIVAFPENKYGDAYINGDLNNPIDDVTTRIQRIRNILADFVQFGASVDDEDAAKTRSGVGSRRRTGRNDVGWDIIQGNYERNLHQIDPEETSQAWWQVDADGIYGRFARAFDHASGKDTMFFQLVDGFITGLQEIEVSITYRNKDAGQWALEYHAIDGTIKTVTTVSNTEAGDVWKTTAPLSITDAQLAHTGPRGSDFMLVNIGSDNCRFHMVEVKKVGIATEILPTGININNCPSGDMSIGATIRLTSSLSPAYVSEKTVSWSSSDHTVASVDSASGLVTAKGIGAATITANTVNNITDSCVVNVTNVLTTGVVISNCPSGDLSIGSRIGLTYTVLPANASNKTVTWSSSNTAVAKVDDIGLITAVSLGSATITVTTNDGGFTDDCEVKVVIPVVRVTGVFLSGCPLSKIKIDSTHQLVATVSPTDADDQTITWSSSNIAVASVDESGLITAISAGNSTITVITADGSYSDLCIVTVDSSEVIDGIQPISQLNGIKVYPNPASDKLHLNLPESTLIKRIRIYNTNGQLLLWKNTLGTHLVIDVDDFKEEELLVIKICMGQNTTSINVLVTGK